jgi:hypothetical protein
MHAKFVFSNCEGASSITCEPTGEIVIGNADALPRSLIVNVLANPVAGWYAGSLTHSLTSGRFIVTDPETSTNKTESPGFTVYAPAVVMVRCGSTKASTQPRLGPRLTLTR